MASTRNKNTVSDYRIEQKALLEEAGWYTAKERRYAYQTRMPQTGINVGHMPNDVLAHNATDIESRLYGIGLSNLVEMPKPVVPEPIKQNYQEETFYYRPEHTWIPEPLIVEKKQRPVIFRR